MWVAYDEQGLSLVKNSRELVAPTCKNILNTTELPVEETQATEILLFYKYVELAPDAEKRVLVWQQAIGKQLLLTGRIHVGPEGINGTCGGSPSSCVAYIASFNAIPEMRGVAFKRSRIPENFAPFPLWHVQRTTEIIALGLPGEYPADSGALHTPPEQWHHHMQTASAADLVIDCRNMYESAVGRFHPPHAKVLRAETRRFDQFPEWAAARLDQLRAAPQVFMYCTGGIRCERASSLLKSRGVNVTAQLEGGIHEYINYCTEANRLDSSKQQQHPGFFKGRNFVFDRRMITSRVDDSVVGECANESCRTECDTYQRGNKCSQCQCLVLLCTTCQRKRQHIKPRCELCKSQLRLTGENTSSSAYQQTDRATSE